MENENKIIELKNEEIDRNIEFEVLKKQFINSKIGDEIEFSVPDERWAEFRLNAWIYRQKKNGFFFRRETRGNTIFWIRYK